MQKMFTGACYNTHPPLKLPGTEFVIYGGNCSSPVFTEAKVYIGFDSSMRWTPRHWPWKKGAEVLFKISDRSVPQDVEEYRKLVDWTKKQIEEGVAVHAGCIGGHGRTGLFLAALVSQFGEKDAISYVRAHYCSKAVESSEQVKFLVDHFGVVLTGPAKGFTSDVKYKSVGDFMTGHTQGSSRQQEPQKVSPVSGRSIWDASAMG